MATEKILIFDEAGNAKRMKVRIARFLDNEPVTASDKTNIRTTLDVDDSLSGTFTTPLSVTSASDSSFTGGGNLNVSGGKTTLTNDSDNALVVETTNQNPMIVNVVGTAPNYLFDVRDDDTSKFRVDGSGRVGIGGSPSSNLHVYSSTADNLRLERDATNDWRIQLTSGALAFRDATADLERWRIDSSGNLVANSTGIDFGSGANTTIDSYETGTFTPTIYYQNPTGLTISYTTQNGYYTKIGNTVTVHAKVVWTVTGTPVNDNIGIQSFPFSFKNNDLFLLCADSAGASSVGQAGGSTYTATALTSSYTGNLADDIGSGSKTMIMSGTYLTNQ